MPVYREQSVKGCGGVFAHVKKGETRRMAWSDVTEHRLLQGK